MQFTEFIQWSFLGLVSAGVAILYKMKDSMNELNLKLAVFVERIEHHGNMLDKLEIRLDHIEKVTNHCENHRSNYK